MSKKVKNKIPFYKKNKFKFSTISTVIIVIFMICLVAVNILASFLSDRFTAFSVDLTSSSDYTISDKNREYIEKIDKPITILLTCTEEYYVSDYLLNINQYYTDTSGGKYFKQTIELLKNYEKINKNITVKFVDATTPAFNEYKERYSSDDLTLGDVIVDYTYTTNNDTEKTKYKVISLEDLYVIEQNSDSTYSTYGSITGSSVETSVTSALYYVTKEQQDKIAVITGYGSADVSDYLNNLEISGYDYTEISDLEIDDIPDDATMLMLAAPTLDLTQKDVKKIDEFLLGKAGDNEFNYGRSLIYFASNSQTDTPNLDGLLEEWGITSQTGTVYETDPNKHSSSSNTVILLEDAGSDFTTELNTNLSYITDNIRPMKIKFESSGKFNTYEILKSSDTCVVQPYKNSDSWNAKNENQSSFSSLILSRFATEDTEKDSARFSNVLAVGSIDFISSTYLSGSYIGNDELMLAMLDVCANRQTETYEIDNKEINQALFTPTEIQANTIFIICVIIIPLITIGIGIAQFVIRKRR